MKKINKILVVMFITAIGLVNFANEIVITVNANKSKGKVRETVFGHNVEACDNRGIFSRPANAAKPSDLEVMYAQGYWDPIRNQPAEGVLKVMKNFKFGALRYPGGCLAHNYRWKESVGPIEDRGSDNWKFGVDEYLTLCRALKCEPLFIITDYAYEMKDIPQDAADLIEYLNMPATEEYPWAMKRAKNGHKEPYGVKYFELGNETYHGNHACKPSRCYSAEEYVEYFNSTVKAMKKVDSSILVGTMSGARLLDEWNPIVMKGTVKNADFAIIHKYYPQVEALSSSDAFIASMSGTEQFDYELEAFNKIMADAGKVLPLAITEFNIRSIAMKPDAYRYSFLAGMQCTELWCRFIQPENNIIMANYWLLLNAMYGVVNTIDGHGIPNDYKGDLKGYKAVARFFQTLKIFTGEVVVPVKIANIPRYNAPASPGVLASYGDKLVLESKGKEILTTEFDFTSHNRTGLKAYGSAKSKSYTIEFDEFGEEIYPVFAFAKRPDYLKSGEGWSVDVSFEAKYAPTDKNTGVATLGFGLMDARGWSATRCAEAVYSINTAKDWTLYTKHLDLLNDTERVAFLTRVQHLNGKISGKLEVRNLKVVAKKSGNFPAYPGVSSYSTMSEDGNKLYLIVFNRTVDKELPVLIKLEGKSYSNAKADILYQEDIGAVDYFEPIKEEFSIKNNKFIYKTKPHSMTAFEFSR